MLQVKNLHAQINETPILRGLDLSIKEGEVHAIMGQNGSGKSSFANILMGHPRYTVTQGEITFDDTDLLELEAEERAAKGLFLAFQYPTEIAGVPTSTFLRHVVNLRRKMQGEGELDALQMVKHLRKRAQETGISEQMLKRPLNYGFSGGEKKRLEIYQMCLLEPRLVILDETDSGLDIDALKHVGATVNKMRDQARSFLIITHYQRLLDHIKPDTVHVMDQGAIVDSGGADLALRLEKEGYGTQLAS